MAMDSRPFVLGLSGLSGAGKTTLARALTQQWPGVRALYYDRYQPLTRLPLPEIQAWFARGGDPNEIDHGELLTDLSHEIQSQSGLAEKPLLVFETPFGRLHRDTGAFIDFLVWVDTPLDIALARAVLAFTMVAREETSPRAAQGFIDWQIQYMTNYPSVREMYRVQRERIKPLADLTLDGTLPCESSLEILKKALEKWGGFQSRGAAWIRRMEVLRAIRSCQ
jgi:uridine kinase